jgi:succinate dehydrogenase / fumarate reductase cytochrome b subunit
MMKTLILVRGSSVLKKIILALSGLLLFTFVFVHLLGNLFIFSNNPNAINLYAHKLEGLGLFLRIIEVILLIIFLGHLVYSVVIAKENIQARPQGYYQLKTAGNPSQKSIFSRSMIYTGPLLLLFILVHLKTFRFGPGMAEGYIADVNGVMMRDLHRLIIETFHKSEYTIAYIVAMIPLGFHLRHGFKSAFQSLGVNHPNLTPFLDKTGLVLALVLTLGFISVPAWIYITGVN